jgi:hypothetical protein
MEGEETARVLVRPFAGQSDYERMIDYFLGAEEAFLRGWGSIRTSCRNGRPGSTTALFMGAFGLRRLY